MQGDAPLQVPPWCHPCPSGDRLCGPWSIPFPRVMPNCSCFQPKPMARSLKRAGGAEAGGEQVENFRGDPMAVSLGPSPPSACHRVEVWGHPWQVRALPCRVRPARGGARLCPSACGEEGGAPGQAGQSGGFGGRGRGRGLHCRRPGAGPQNRGGSWPGAVPRCWLCPVPTAPLCRCPQPVPPLWRLPREMVSSSSGMSPGPVPCWPLPSGISVRRDVGPRECPEVGQGHDTVGTPVPTCSLVSLPGTPMG